MRRMRWAVFPRGRRPAAAYRAGRRAARRRLSAAEPGRAPDVRMLNDAWCAFRGGRRYAARSHRKYMADMRAFLRGFATGAPLPRKDPVLLPTRQTVGAVVTAMNEAATLSSVLGQLARLPLAETVVIVNGSRDDSFAVARRFGATTVHYADPLGHDVGRALGAKLTETDIVLFLDGDILIRAEQLLPFIAAVHRGIDVALNNLTPFLGPLRQWDDVTLMKAFLNHCLDRADLAANSLTAVPHALSRRAIGAIGPRELMVPPRALVRAVLRGLAVAAPASVNVIAANKRRRLNTGKENPVSELIVGDHLEAIHALKQLRGPRLGFADAIRNRRAAEMPETAMAAEAGQSVEYAAEQPKAAILTNPGPSFKTAAERPKTAILANAGAPGGPGEGRTKHPAVNPASADEREPAAGGETA